MNKSRILFLSHYFPPEGNAPASRVYEMAKRWVQAGHAVTVVTCVPNHPHGTVYPGYKSSFRPQSEYRDGIKVVRVWTYIAANKGTLRRIINFVSYMISTVFVGLFLPKQDIIIATSPQFFCGWAGLLLGRLRRCPFILEIRDLWPDTIIAVGALQNRKLLGLLRYLEKKLYAGATHIVTVGQGYKHKIISKGVPFAKISIIPNGADMTFFQPRKPDDDIIRKYHLQNSFVCGYVGTLGLCSGLAVVPQAAKILQDSHIDDITFLLVGDGAVKEQLQQQCQRLLVDNNVVFTGMQDKQMMPQYLSVIDVCLAHLQKKELFKTVIPSKIFEAAAMQKPVILGVEGYAADLLKESGGGICIEPENPQALVKAILDLRKNPDLCTSMGQAGYNYVKRYYNRDKLAEEYLEIIHIVVHELSCRVKHNILYKNDLQTGNRKKQS